MLVYFLRIQIVHDEEVVIKKLIYTKRFDDGETGKIKIDATGSVNVYEMYQMWTHIHHTHAHTPCFKWWGEHSARRSPFARTKSRLVHKIYFRRVGPIPSKLKRTHGVCVCVCLDIQSILTAGFVLVSSLLLLFLLSFVRSHSRSNYSFQRHTRSHTDWLRLCKQSSSIRLLLI